MNWINLWLSTVTKKEFEYVSGSEDEQLPTKNKDDSKKNDTDKKSSPRNKESKTEASEPPKKKSKVSPTKTKQSSIMSFFKKK